MIPDPHMISVSSLLPTYNLSNLRTAHPPISKIILQPALLRGEITNKTGGKANKNQMNFTMLISCYKVSLLENKIALGLTAIDDNVMTSNDDQALLISPR